VIAVEDTGIGITPEFLPYVFDRFTQADGSATRRHGGLGLGMAIVRHLVELHGGTVTAFSEGENRGTTFTAILPMRVAIPPEAPEELEPQQLETSEGLPNLEGVRILVVDDEPDSRSFLSTLLQKQGATVSVAGSAGEAIDAFTAGRPDVLVSDIAMPGQDGYDLIRHVRDLAPHDGGRTPAVALTAYVRAEDADAALTAGYQRHIRKPVVVEELIGAVAALAASAAPSPD
jgi:CheY-like chemotaxis protein